MAADSDKSKPYIPLASLADDGWSKEDEVTATSLCSAVQLAFAWAYSTLLCASARTTIKSPHPCSPLNFTVDDTYLRHLRGRDYLKTFSQSLTVASGNEMINYFCSLCGMLMYRVGGAFLGKSILGIGTVDDFYLDETKLRPGIEPSSKYRRNWWSGMGGVKHVEAEHKPGDF